MIQINISSKALEEIVNKTREEGTSGRDLPVRGYLLGSKAEGQATVDDVCFVGCDGPAMPVEFYALDQMYVSRVAMFSERSPKDIVGYVCYVDGNDQSQYLGSENSFRLFGDKSIGVMLRVFDKGYSVLTQEGFEYQPAPVRLPAL